jgi:hypothetical protein
MSTIAHEELVKQYAFDLFIKRGSVHGYHHEDWLQAENHVRGQNEVPKATRQPPSRSKKTVKSEAIVL